MKILRLVFLFIIVFVLMLGAYTLHAGAERFLTDGVREAAGAPVEIEEIRINWLASEVSLFGVKVRNPQGFKSNEAMAVLPLIFFTYDPQALLRGRLRIPEMKVFCESVTVEKNSRNRINWIEIEPVRSRFNQAESKAAPRAGKIAIEKLELAMARGEFQDFSLGSRMAVREYPIRIKLAEMKNVRHPRDLTTTVALIAVLKAGWRTLEPDPSRLPRGLLMRGDALLEQVQNIFGVSAEDLRNLLKNS